MIETNVCAVEVIVFQHYEQYEIMHEEQCSDVCKAQLTERDFGAVLKCHEELLFGVLFPRILR